MPPIENVVVLMLENHSFDRMLGCMTALHPKLDGVDPTHPHSNPDPDGGVVLQRPTTTRNIERDPKHYMPDALRQLDGGTCRGFVADFVHTHPQSTKEERAEVMAYYPRGFLPALHTLAETGVICDHWFSSMPGPTWMNRLFAHSGTSSGDVQEPGGLFSSKLHLYHQRTLYDELSAAGVTWRIYFGNIPQSLVLTRQLHHLGNYRWFSRWKDDVAKGDLPAYTFIEPSYFGPHQNDQHPPHDIMLGDKLIADVYNALRANPDLFARTLLIVLYDEHGGFYDHVPPPATIAPDDHTERFAFNVLGPRVPAILLSPMLDPGVQDIVLDHTSLLKMASQLWHGVTPLGRRAAAARSPLEGLSWRRTPRTDMPEAPVAPDIQPARHLLSLEGFKRSLYGFSHHLESQIAHPGRRAALMRRKHEALEDGAAQAQLATDRLETFLHDQANPAGLLTRLWHGLVHLH